MNNYTELRKVHCENTILAYQLTRKKVKNVNLRIKTDGRILVSANNRVPVQFIDNFVREKQDFILSALKRYENYNGQAITKNKTSELRQYTDGECYKILGESYILKVLEAEKEEVYTGLEKISKQRLIILKVRDMDNFCRKEKLIKLWLKDYQSNVFKEICDDTYLLFKNYNLSVPYPVIKIRSMKSRWGSCRPTKGIITLNSKLIEKKRRCIEYVVVHEFAHFIHPNHSKQFHALVTSLMPDWLERKQELNKIL